MTGEAHLAVESRLRQRPLCHRSTGARLLAHLASFHIWARLRRALLLSIRSRLRGRATRAKFIQPAGGMLIIRARLHS